MKNDDKTKDDISGFPQFGKRLPYEVPSAFFDEFSGKTLELAKQKAHSRHVVKLWYLGVAASILVVAFLSFWVAENNKKVIVAEVKLEATPAIQEQKPIEQPIALPEPKKKEISQDGPKNLEVKETVSDILADLTDEELGQLDAMIKTDPFMQEGSMNNLNE